MTDYLPDWLLGQPILYVFGSIILGMLGSAAWELSRTTYVKTMSFRKSAAIQRVANVVRETIYYNDKKIVFAFFATHISLMLFLLSGMILLSLLLILLNPMSRDVSLSTFTLIGIPSITIGILIVEIFRCTKDVFVARETLSYFSEGVDRGSSITPLIARLSRSSASEVDSVIAKTSKRSDG